MRLKEVFKFKGRSSKESESVDILMVETEPLDVPNVVFEDMELQVTVGQWLGILSSKQGFGNSGFTFYVPLRAEDLMKRWNIPTEKLEEIASKFGHLLQLAGIDKEETCTLGQFDEKDFSFNCHFNNSGTYAKIALRWGNMDFGPKFIMDYQNGSKTYNYDAAYEDKPARLTLQHYTIKNPENGNSCYRFLSPYSAQFSLTNGEYDFSIEIGKPEMIDIDVLSGYVFRPENEEQLQQFLLGLTFPFDIGEVYKKICGLSARPVYEYPKFKIEVKRKIDKKKDKTTDMLSLNHGQLIKAIMTRDGKTIAIDSAGNWSYDSARLSVSQSETGDVNYSLNAIPSAELLNATSVYDQYNEVSQEVEQVRKLTRTILGENEN